MPIGRYPERIKAFKKWSTEKVDKGTITDRATSTGSRRRWKKSSRRRKKSD